MKVEEFLHKLESKGVKFSVLHNITEDVHYSIVIQIPNSFNVISILSTEDGEFLRPAYRRNTLSLDTEMLDMKTLEEVDRCMGTSTMLTSTYLEGMKMTIREFLKALEGSENFDGYALFRYNFEKSGKYQCILYHTNRKLAYGFKFDDLDSDKISEFITKIQDSITFDDDTNLDRLVELL